jgi:protein-tyrosine-phosphatase
MAEALLREVAGNRAIGVYSTGDEPSAVHPLTVQVLAAEGINSQGLRSKQMNELDHQHFDYVVTVCDRVREHCPILPGDVALVHWSFADPAAVQGSDEERYGAFADSAQRLRVRIEHLLMVIDQNATASASIRASTVGSSVA